MPTFLAEPPTHFIRLKALFHRRFSSPVESLVVQAVPLDRLVTLEDVYTSLQHLCKINRQKRPGRRALSVTLGLLAERGFIGELSGKQLLEVLSSRNTPSSAEEAGLPATSEADTAHCAISP